MKILDIAIKDLTRSLRSLFFVGMMIGAPLLLIGLIYMAFGGMSSNNETAMPSIRVVFVNQDSLPADAPLEDDLGTSIGSMFFDPSVESWIDAWRANDPAEARTQVENRQADVAVIVPPDFTARFMAGDAAAQVQIISDPLLTIAPQIVENMVGSLLDGFAGGGVAAQTMVERMQANQVVPDPAVIQSTILEYSQWYADFQRNLFHHPQDAALALTAPAASGETEEAASQNSIQSMLGLMFSGQMIFFAFFTAANAMGSILREEEEGTLHRLITTPTGRTEILAGKFLAVFLSVTLQGIVLIIASALLFQINWGNPLPVALALIGQIVAAGGLGVLLIAFVRNSKQLGPVLGGVLTLLAMLSGLFTSNIHMPEAFTMLANFTPQGWVMNTWRLVLNGSAISELLLPLAILLGLGGAMFAAGSLLFQRRYA